MHFLALLLLFLSTLSIMNGEAEAEAKAIKGFSIDLIHRDSPLSPFYNSSLTQSDLLRNAALRSMSRVHRFHHLSVAETSELAQTDIIPNDGNYLMKIFIGTPPIETLAIADTGSDLIWVQCTPCPTSLCYPQNAPLFDPHKSSTYTPVSCDSQTCSLLPTGQFGCESSTSKQCVYIYQYGDMVSFTMGDLATESISLGTTGGQTASFPKSVFGCGHNNNGKFRSTTAGLVGLGNGPLSLVSQLGGTIGRKFSYCFPPFGVQHTTKLRFGEEATLSGSGVMSTPLVASRSPTFYTLTLQGITIGQKTAQISESDGNIVIDSGTTLTYLAPSFYEEVESLVKEAIGAKEAIEQNPPEPYKLCYASQSINNFPEFVVHFKGADVTLKPQNFFLQINKLLCFAVVPQEEISLYGNVAQFNFQVEYDLDGGKVSFAPADCTKQ